MKIAVVGAGAVGGFFAAYLIRAGHEVHFLARSDLQVLREQGLKIDFPGEPWVVRPAGVHERAESIGPAGWVMCAVKTTAMERVASLLRPCMGQGSLLLNLMNGLGVEEELARWFDADRILGCLAYVSAHRFSPGVITPQTPGRLVVGHLTGNQELAEAVVGVLQSAGIQARATANLHRARWEKLVWNAAFNPLSVSAGGVSARQILADQDLRAMVAELMREVIRIAQAEGCELDADRLVARMLELTGAFGDIHTSMLVDYQARRPLELEWILAEPLRRAASTGTPAPLLGAQLHLCRFLDRANRQPRDAKQ